MPTIATIARAGVSTSISPNDAAISRDNPTRNSPNYMPFAVNSKQPYGLIGPVRLIPFAQATLATFGAS